MATTFLNEENMRDIIWGATLMGGGGGGSISSGMMLLDSYKKDHPDETLSVKMIDAGDMPDGTYAAATAGMGAPAAIAGVDFSQWAANAFAVLQDLAARDGKKLGYNYPVELGGFSTFFPLLLSLKTGLPTIDCDGAGRAVPALETLLLNVNDCPTSPLGLANGDNDKITIELENPLDAPTAEKIGRNISGAFGNMVGISGWLVDKDDIKKRICTNTISLSQKIGEIMRKANTPVCKRFEALAIDLKMDVKVICKGKVLDIQTQTHGGFDYGTMTVRDDREGYNGDEFRIIFQNENLVLNRLVDGVAEPLMTVPDLTCFYCIDPHGLGDAEPGMPLSNADARVGMDIAVAVIKVDPKWFANQTSPTKWWDVWAECMKTAEYPGGYLSYDHVVARPDKD